MIETDTPIDNIFTSPDLKYRTDGGSNVLIANCISHKRKYQIVEIRC